LFVCLMVRIVFVAFVACLIAVCSAESVAKTLESLPPVEEFDDYGLSPRAAIYELPTSEWPDNGCSGDVNMYPSFDERSMGLWINVARIGYTWYRDTYMKPIIDDGSGSQVFDGSGKSMGSVAPGYFHFNLARAARGHCDDVWHNCRDDKNTAHNDCNGTSCSERIHRFHSGGFSEIFIRIAPGSGLYRGFGSVASWVCDGFHYVGGTIPTLTKCCTDSGKYPDGSPGQNGHREAVMGACSNWGCGAYGSDTEYTSTCDCTGSSPGKYSGLYIAAASHVGDPSDSKKFLYMATIATSGITVSSLKVIVESAASKETISMKLLHQGAAGAVYGTDSYAHYEQCRTYYFELSYGGKTERYPANGYLYTYGMSCTDNWKINKLSPDCSSGTCCDTNLGLFRPSSYKCREATGDCDLDEFCTGASADCPADQLKPQGTICDRSSGDCEDNAVCTGSDKKCPAKKKHASGTVCRNSTGPCDAPEVCDGVNATCPPNSYYPSGTICNESSGPCEENAVCSGYSVSCPSKRVKSRYVTCRNSTGLCDPEEKCDGENITCPADVKRPAGYICNSTSSLCEFPGVCNGIDGFCPPRSFKPNRTLCREPTSPCDAGGFCNGISTFCNSERRPKGFVCNASRGGCETDGVCSGSSTSCPTKRILSAGVRCRAAVGLCDLEEYCDGTSYLCPEEQFKPAGTECVRVYNCTIEDSQTGAKHEGTCTEVQYCTGDSGFCPFELESAVTLSSHAMTAIIMLSLVVLLTMM